MSKGESPLQNPAYLLRYNYAMDSVDKQRDEDLTERRKKSRRRYNSFVGRRSTDIYKNGKRINVFHASKSVPH